jgi:hypothetical protein
VDFNGYKNGVAGNHVPPFTDPNSLYTGWRTTHDMARILDGTSSTLLVGEKHIPIRYESGRHPDWSIFNSDLQSSYVRAAGRDGATLYPLVANPADESTNAILFQFGSAHPGICQFVLVDGSVRPVRNAISLDVLHRLSARSDGQPINAGDF